MCADLTQKEHDYLQWDGRDLICVVDISLLESLCGWTRDVRAINGTKLRVQRNEVTPPTWSYVYHGLGMSSSDQSGNLSDLVIKVNVEYPETISPYQDKIFKRILSPRREFSPRMQQLLEENQYCI